ncbi:two-component system, chemotaxis family, sensor kinase CheA [Roseomonas rosea]|uniref:Chemotaxis protein CheA n=1 Tax=Muricoccus roseus TaxID=198092 RepID=A0A1M6PF04_9PROT|nr:chemotaxis protein CheA [Roseomonas rosea]SHK06494.1 two-component system, chemotaxis family, sensor kinase CheA [Roseomonas rosea]
MSELLEQFLIEGRELAQQATEDLLALERDPADAARLDSAFRAVHTLKGSVALFDLQPMQRALHAAEDLLDAVRAGRLGVGRGVIDALLDCIGASEAWIEALARTGTLPADAPGRGRGLEEALRAPLQEDSGAQPASAEPPSDASWAIALAAAEAPAVAAAHAAGQEVTALRYVPAADCFFLGDDPMALLRAVPEMIALRLGARQPWPDGAAMDPFACNLVIELLSTAGEAELRQAFRFVADQIATAAIAPSAPASAPASASEEASAPGGAPGLGGRSLRVDAARIDALMDLVGEMIVAKNGLAHLVAQVVAQLGEADPRLARALGESQAGIEALAEQMHRTVLGVRMTPLARSFNRLPRLVRDAAAELGKTVVLDIRGEAVEADKAIVDGLFDPLLHLLRNAVDHGIEPPEARAGAGKPAAGRITLEARREGEGILVEVADDGRGIDPARIRQAAKARGLMPEAAIDALGDEEAVQLVFRPGFSTASAVTSLSGRGVGMDAVRAAVEALGGRVSLASRPGAGSTIRLLLPQGAAVTTVLLVRLGGEVFGLPSDAVAETARIPAGRILPLRQGEAFVLRDRTVPLVRLSALLDLPGTPRGEMVRMAVVGSGAARVGVEVDGFAGRADVLLRPLPGLLSGMPGLLGTALMGDGQVLMVLDMPGLIG